MKSLKLTITLSALIFTCLLLCSCGGGTTSTSEGGFSTQLNKSSSLRSLNADEVKQLCEATNDFLTRTFEPENICELAAVVVLTSPDSPFYDGGGLDAKFCKELVGECKRDAEIKDISNASNIDCSQNSFSGDKCNLPVEMYEKCLNEIFSEMDTLRARASCSSKDETLISDFTAFTAQDFPQTPSCAALVDACPGIKKDK